MTATHLAGVDWNPSLEGIVRFDATEHAYFVGTLRIPSVTQVLKATGVARDFELLVENGYRTRAELDDAIQVGQAVHLATHYDDLGELKPGTVDPRAEGGLRAWRKFRADTGFRPTLLETRLHHPGLLFGGTLDRAGYFEHFEGHDPTDLYMIDLKCGDPEDAAAQWQTAAYVELLAVNLDPKSRFFRPVELRARPRYSVELRREGTYKLHRYPDPFTDWNRFQSFLTTFRLQHIRRVARCGAM